jgi:glucoside 3-dehydrogenase (cytochrome c) hitch-hiker subunit
MADERSIPATEERASEVEPGVSRREVIKLGAALVATSIAGIDVARADSLQSKPVQAEGAPRFFTAEEFALVDELCELIIPADDHSPGSRAAKVAAYIDFRLSESWDEQPKTQWRDGLKRIEQLSQETNGKSFIQSTQEQRVALLTRIAAGEMKPEKPEEFFFKELKSRTVHAYYTSKIGIHDEIGYKGNTYLKEFVGYDAT